MFIGSPSLVQVTGQVTTERVVDGHLVGLQSANLETKRWEMHCYLWIYVLSHFTWKFMSSRGLRVLELCVPGLAPTDNTLVGVKVQCKLWQLQPSVLFNLSVDFLAQCWGQWCVQLVHIHLDLKGQVSTGKPGQSLIDEEGRETEFTVLLASFISLGCPESIRQSQPLSCKCWP